MSQLREEVIETGAATGGDGIAVASAKSKATIVGVIRALEIKKNVGGTAPATTNVIITVESNGNEDVELFNQEDDASSIVSRPMFPGQDVAGDDVALVFVPPAIAGIIVIDVTDADDGNIVRVKVLYEPGL